MTSLQLQQRAAELGVDLPDPPSPQGAYVPAVLHAGLVRTSGMGPMLHGVRHHLGYVGADVSVEQAQEAARIAAVNALVAALGALGGVEHLDRVVSMTGYVRSAPGFVRQNEVLNGASQVLHDLLGEAGVHARASVGVAELPFGIPVEVDLTLAAR